MDMPFDGSHLFGEKADAVLENFKDRRVTAHPLGLSTAPPPTELLHQVDLSDHVQISGESAQDLQWCSGIIQNDAPHLSECEEGPLSLAYIH